MKKLKARLDAIEKSNKKESEAKEKKEKASTDAETNQKNCQAATNNLKVLENGRRVRMKMNDGSSKVLPEEQRAAEIDKAKKAIEKFCK
jgi:hypothetical protein